MVAVGHQWRGHATDLAAYRLGRHRLSKVHAVVMPQTWRHTGVAGIGGLKSVLWSHHNGGEACGDVGGEGLAGGAEIGAFAEADLVVADIG